MNQKKEKRTIKILILEKAPVFTISFGIFFGLIGIIALAMQIILTPFFSNFQSIGGMGLK